MKKHPEISVVSPVYNDGPAVADRLHTLDILLKKLHRTYEIICIDDASSDESGNVAVSCMKRMRHLRVYTHTENKGIAKTYRELYKKATGDLIVLYSLDGEWDPKDVIRLITAQKMSGLDIVIGKRKHKQYTRWRAFVSSTYNALTNRLFGVVTVDAGSIKIFRRKVADTPIISFGVFDEAERIIKATRKGFTLGHIAISHNRTVKKKRGIRIVHVIEAIIDMSRVYIEMYIHNT